MKVIKSGLILTHANSDVERSFSESGKNVTQERVSLSESPVNGTHGTSDGMKALGNDPSAVPIIKELLQLGRSFCTLVQRLKKTEEKKENGKREKSVALLEERKEELEKESKQ